MHVAIGFRELRTLGYPASFLLTLAISVGTMLWMDLRLIGVAML